MYLAWRQRKTKEYVLYFPSKRHGSCIWRLNRRIWLLRYDLEIRTHLTICNILIYQFFPNPIIPLRPVKTPGNRRNTRNHSVNLRMIARIPNFIHSSPGKTDQWRTPISSFFLTCLDNKTPVLSCRSQDRPPDSSRFFAWFFQN